MITLETTGPDETEEVGRAIAAVLRPGDVVALRGELGVGKTTLVRGAARALGVTDHVTSPTFTVGQRYAGTVSMAHLDAYRLGAVDDEELGLALEIAEDAIAFVEWPEAVEAMVADSVLTVTLAHQGRDRRLLTLTISDERVENVLRSRLSHLDHPRIRHGDPGPESRPPGG